jgi:hypothetical protein
MRSPPIVSIDLSELASNCRISTGRASKLQPTITEGDLMFRRKRVAGTAALVVSLAAVFAGVGLASAPPVGPLPPGPSSTIQTTKGQLVAFALPHRAGGRVWRVARTAKASVLRQVSEADVGNQVVLVYVATGRGTTSIAFGLTLGERAKAYESRRYTVTVRS